MRKGTKIIVNLQIFFTFEFISAAKVLYQTAKTCQYVKEFYKKMHFFNFWSRQLVPKWNELRKWSQFATSHRVLETMSSQFAITFPKELVTNCDQFISFRIR